MLSRLKTLLSRHFSQHITSYFVVTLCFSIGIASGVFSVKALSDLQKDQLLDFLVNSFKSVLGQSDIDSSRVLLNSIINNLKTILLIWIFSISMIAFPLVYVVVGIRGFVLGFTVGFLMDNLGYTGIIFSTVAILPQNLIFIPVLVILGVVSVNYSVTAIKNRKGSRYTKGERTKLLLGYTMLTLIFFGLFFISSLIEAYLSPIFLRGVSAYLIN